MRNSGDSLSPHAVILRVNAYEDLDRPEKITSCLAVVKITDSDICVIDRILATGSENVAAREAADTSSEGVSARNVLDRFTLGGSTVVGYWFFY